MRKHFMTDAPGVAILASIMTGCVCGFSIWLALGFLLISMPSADR